MSARRELSALWSRCDWLRERLGPPGCEPGPDARRLLDAASDELASALRRLVSAGMLTPVQTRELEEALGGLAAAGNGGGPPATAIAGYALALQRVAAGLHIGLVPRPAEIMEEVVDERPAWSWASPVAERAG
jgi:hypothetical protein